MTQRCHYEYEAKDGYPDDLICLKCQTIWTVIDYLDWDYDKLRTLPRAVRDAAMKRKIKQEER